MKINWKARFKNKAFVSGLLALLVSFSFEVLSLFGVIPGLNENEVLTIVNVILNLLVVLGVIADPTTKGIGDSKRALTYYKSEEEF